MKKNRCENCGAPLQSAENGYMICPYCKSKANNQVEGEEKNQSTNYSELVSPKIKISWPLFIFLIIFVPVGGIAYLVYCSMRSKN